MGFNNMGSIIFENNQKLVKVNGSEFYRLWSIIQSQSREILSPLKNSFFDNITYQDHIPTNMTDVPLDSYHVIKLDGNDMALIELKTSYSLGNNVMKTVVVILSAVLFNGAIISKNILKDFSILMGKALSMKLLMRDHGWEEVIDLMEKADSDVHLWNYSCSGEPVSDPFIFQNLDSMIGLLGDVTAMDLRDEYFRNANLS